MTYTCSRTLHQQDLSADLGQFQASLGRSDQLQADHLLIYRGDGGPGPMATHLGEPPHGLLPNAGKVLQCQAMRSQGLHYLQQQAFDTSGAHFDTFKQVSDQAPVKCVWVSALMVPF